MNIKDLKVGDKVFIREDLVHSQEYGNAVYYKVKGSGERTIDWFHNDNKDTFVTEEDNHYYTVEMIDWEKTIKIRREKMKINDLKVGDVVFIREDLEPGENYGDYMYMGDMCKGVQKIKSIYKDCESFKLFGSFDFYYTLEMIDWDKTKELRAITKSRDNTVYNPSHYSGGGKHDIECYKAIEYILDRLENVPEKYFGHVSNIVKYIWRCNDKNGYEDLDKASVYFDFMFRKED